MIEFCCYLTIDSPRNMRHIKLAFPLYVSGFWLSNFFIIVSFRPMRLLVYNPRLWSWWQIIVSNIKPCLNDPGTDPDAVFRRQTILWTTEFGKILPNLWEILCEIHHSTIFYLKLFKIYCYKCKKNNLLISLIHLKQSVYHYISSVKIPRWLMII